MVAFRFQERDMIRHWIRNLLVSTTCIVFCCTSLPAQKAVPLPELNSKRLLNDLQVIVASTPRLGEDMTIGLVVRYGSAFDSLEKGGLANFLSRMFMRSTVDRRLKDIQADLASLGATLEIQCDWDSYHFILKGQSSRFEGSLYLLYQIVCEAQFTDADFAAVKQEILKEIQRPPDPRRKIRSQFENVLFSGTTYGRSLAGTPKTIAAINVGEVRRFYHKFFSPNESSLIIVGNVSYPLVLQKASRIWGSWVRVDKVEFTFKPPLTPAGRQVFLEDDPGSPAAQFIIGSLFPSRDDPDYVHAVLAAYILQERLTKLLPTSLLTVGYEGRRKKGPFYIQGQAAVEQAVEQIQKIQNAAEEMKSALVSDEELASAKKSLIEEFNKQFGSTEGICRIMLDTELYRLGSNHVVSHTDRIQRCDKEIIKEAANSWMLPGGAILLIRGPADALKPTLESIGSYKQILP
jgi:zinc protease